MRKEQKEKPIITKKYVYIWKGCIDSFLCRLALCSSVLNWIATTLTYPAPVFSTSRPGRAFLFVMIPQTTLLVTILFFGDVVVIILTSWFRQTLSTISSRIGVTLDLTRESKFIVFFSSHVHIS